MIDGEYLLCWQKHWDRSPGTTTVMVHGPDPVGKSPDVGFISMLRLGYELESSRKIHNGFFFSVQINWSFLCVLNSLWVIHFSKRLLGYSKHVMWRWGKTRRPNRDRSTPSMPFSHLQAWHHNNQTKPVLIHLVESRGHGHDLMKPISHSSHMLRETGSPRPVEIPQLLDKRISNKGLSQHRGVDKTKGLCPILTKIEFWSNRSSPVGVFSPGHSPPTLSVCGILVLIM